MRRSIGKVSRVWGILLICLTLAYPAYSGSLLPVIVSLTPASGQVGHTITIMGSGLSSATAVAYSGHTAAFTVINDNYITATVPVGAVTGKVTVTTPDGEATSETDFTVYELSSLSVKVDPGVGYLGSLSGISVNYSLDGPQPYTGQSILNDSGESTVNGIQPGSYAFSLFGSHWLNRIVKDVTVDGVGGVNTSLTNGDADGGNSINLFDFVVLDTKWGTADRMADLNGDGQVNLFDYTMVDRTFGALGDIGPQPVTKLNPTDGAAMVWVPAGSFLMGTNATGMANEKPLRSVAIDGFWIYKNEVTVAQYRQFCTATGHGIPTKPVWGWVDDYPIVYVGKADAAAYCAWAGGALPTEAQWEKAARGTDGRVFPWGNTWDASKCANSFVTALISPEPVGSFADGASPYGCMDMAGNVDEWVSDGWDATYYQSAPNINPPGAVNGDYGVIRGGAWDDANNDNYLRSYLRMSLSIGYDRNSHVGFRCMKAE